MFLAALKGLLLQLSLIVAIGPQNALLLRQAVRRKHVWLVAVIFLAGDVLMILLGGFGVGHVLEQRPWLKLAFTLLGAIYVLRFGLMTLRRMGKIETLSASAASSAANIISAALAVTFLNPHAIFDTVILIGTMALQYDGHAKIDFLLGASGASALWFLGVAWIGQKLAPYLSRPAVWRVLDGCIVAVMMILSASLFLDAWHQARALP